MPVHQQISPLLITHVTIIQPGTWIRNQAGWKPVSWGSRHTLQKSSAAQWEMAQGGVRWGPFPVHPAPWSLSLGEAWRTPFQVILSLGPWESGGLGTDPPRYADGRDWPELGYGEKDFPVPHPDGGWSQLVPFSRGKSGPLNTAQNKAPAGAGEGTWLRPAGPTGGCPPQLGQICGAQR